MPPHFVLAGGGTGGHLYPGLAVADALRRREPDCDITFFTTRRDLDRVVLSRTSYHQHAQPVRPLTFHPLRLPGFLVAWRRSVAQARRFLTERGPVAVLGLGGYAAGAPVVAAARLGIRTAILNPDAIPGRANRYLARKVDRVILQWEASRDYFPVGTPCEALGCPIRGEFANALAGTGREHFGLAPTGPVLLATGASQGAHTINASLCEVWPAFRSSHPDWQLLHLTGPADEEMVRKSYAAAGVAAVVLSFCHEMPLALAAADVVIARAGASTLAELTAVGRPAILLPYPYHRDQHQLANARVLADQGAAIVQEDRRDARQNAGPLRSALERLADPAVRRSMQQAAAALGRPQAAAAVAAWLAQAPSGRT